MNWHAGLYAAGWVLACTGAYGILDDWGKRWLNTIVVAVGVFLIYSF